MSTEELILKKTFNLLLIKGFDAVSISDIQASTGLSRGLLYHYFKNKDDLFIQVTEKYFIQMFDFDIQKVKDYDVYEFTDFMCNRFAAIGNTVTDIVADSGAVEKVSILNYHFLFYQVMQRDSVFRDRYRTTIEKELAGWEYALKNSLLKGDLKKEVDEIASARELFTLTDGIWFQGIFNVNGKLVVKGLKKVLLHYIELLK
ncbi:TetR/AcrR family transcriptional regulator [Dysgonomonas sp. BGC7]|uniref:TetR/AcrR family transcriptional regulator n=1 Tax=Dysgonomonas sp. BGC7 TaxID=1658008 RepID=UPI0006816002|nr:TetR/AcrR family transcriptional regulator [Dysgonomonas sp. BGC7]MBD8388492.1 TetR/AcrR family transcriptional regulator [Dysgonomonas sp. BGC7]